jgi:hypothetical protein
VSEGPDEADERDGAEGPAAARPALGDLAPQAQQPVRGPGAADVTDQQ